MPHPKKLQAARDRRSDRVRPLPLDNEALRAVHEESNPLPVQRPTEPRSGSQQERVLRALRRAESATVDELVRRTGLTESQVRCAIDGLRAKAHSIRNTARRRFRLSRARHAA